MDPPLQSCSLDIANFTDLIFPPRTWLTRSFSRYLPSIISFAHFDSTDPTDPTGDFNKRLQQPGHPPPPLCLLTVYRRGDSPACWATLRVTFQLGPVRLCWATHLVTCHPFTIIFILIIIIVIIIIIIIITPSCIWSSSSLSCLLNLSFGIVSKEPFDPAPTHVMHWLITYLHSDQQSRLGVIRGLYAMVQ